MEWVNHQLSAAHLKKLVEAKEKGDNVEDSESTSQETLFAVNVEIGKDDKQINIFKFKGAEFKGPSKEELREMLKEENGQFVLPEGEIVLPGEYQEDTVYGMNCGTDS